MAPAQPLVSGIIIFLNAESFLREAVESVFAQTWDLWELLLVDDGSTDASSATARAYAAAHPDRVTYLEHAGHANRGMSASRNLGIRHARGKYVALLDADDVWRPEKLERQVAILEAHTEAGMVCGPTEYWFSWTGLPSDATRDYVTDLGIESETLYPPPTLLPVLYPLGQAPAPCLCSLLIRRDVLEQVGGFEDSFLGFYEDQAFLTKVYLEVPVFVSSGCWDRYRIHERSCSAGVTRSGQYAEYRKAFLEWFAGYLRTKGTSDPRVLDALEPARRERQPGTGPNHRWLLRTAGGNVARLIVTPDAPDSVRVGIIETRTTVPYDTQLNLPGLPLDAIDYRLTFRARSDAPRSIGVGVAMGHSPWTNLGLYADVALSDEWQSFEREFRAPEREPDARIHFDLGAQPISVELASVSLTRKSDGQPVVPSPTDPSAAGAGTNHRPVEPAVPYGAIDFGSLRRLTPISPDFGCDRGRPIDRYYIERFLETYAEDVRGRVLEVGERTYTQRFGADRVQISDVLRVTPGEPDATIIADLASADHIPSDSFDCVILTQTLQLIYDVPAALRTLHRVLKPGGVLLTTFPGISQTYDHEWSQTWYWNFTTVSARRLFGDAFGAPHVQVESHGNVLAAIAFLHGIAVEELSPPELDYRDPGYDVTIAVRAVKPRETGPHVSRFERATDSVKTPVQNLRPSTGAGALILMYHRIAAEGTDPFGLAVSPQNFSEQLDVLCRYTQPVPLRALAVDIARQRTRPVSVVTFDDGYSDNLRSGKPELARHGVPATVFVTTGFIGGGREFWWDALDRVLLQPGVLPARLAVTIRGTQHEWDLGDAAVYPEASARRDRKWRVSEPPPSSRQAAYLGLWRLLQFLPDSERQAVLESLVTAAALQPSVRSTHRQLTPEEIVELATDGLIDVGSHTVTHPVLAPLPVSLQRREIEQSKLDLEAILGRQVHALSYPFGSSRHYTAETIALVRQAGYSLACSTNPLPVETDSDWFELPRMQVENWNGEEFARRLAAWVV